MIQVADQSLTTQAAWEANIQLIVLYPVEFEDLC